MADFDAPPVVGTRLGRYLFLREIAAGIFGSLYELRSEEEAIGLSGLGRVINLSPELDPDAEEAIVASAWESLELRHENALCVADVVFGKGWVTLVHDYTQGSLLQALHARARERRSTFPTGVALRIITDVIEGLRQNRQVCEAAGITWTPGGTNASSLYLCGDGRTRSLDGQLVFTLLRKARTHTRISEALFSAPETLSAEAQVDERTDVFAAGTVLWQLLTGLAFSDVTAKSSSAHARTALPKVNLAVSGNASKVPLGLARALDSALEMNPTKRPATLVAFRNALTRDSEIASYTQVIEFTDALLHRESTLFRLALDPEPKLSDELRVNKTVPAHQDWALELAKRARVAADAPRPAITAPPKQAPAVTSRMKAPAVSLPAARTAIGAQPGRPVTTLKPQPAPVASGKSVHRTLLGISPMATAGHAAAGVATAAPLQVETQATNVAQTVSEVQRVVPPEATPHTACELAIGSNSHQKAGGNPAAAEFEVSSAPGIAPQPARPTLPADAAPEGLIPPAPQPRPAQSAACPAVQSPAEDTFSRRKAVVQLTPLAIAGWSLVMVCVSTFATLALQRVFASTSPASPLPTPVSTAASQLSPNTTVAVEISSAPKPHEEESLPQPVATGEPTARVAEQPVSAAPSARPQSAGQPPARAAARAAPAAPKQYPKTRKRRYVPRGL